MGDKDPAIIYNKHLRFLKNTYGKNSLGQTSNTQLNFLKMHRAIVISVLTSVDRGSDSFALPPYSINAKVIGVSSSSPNPLEDAPTWFAPLFPPHLMSLPEVGEEILVIYEHGDIQSYAFWITRVWNDNFLSKSLAREQTEKVNPVERYGFPFETRDITNTTYPTVYPVYSIPIRLGDVVQQGRADTYIRHSYNPLQGSGVRDGLLEIGLKQGGKKYSVSEDEMSVLGKTRTKGVHYITSNIYDIIKIDHVPTKNVPIVNVEQSHIVNFADKIINVSPSGSPNLYSQILGEEQNKFNERVLKIIDQIEGSVTSLQTAVASLQSSITGLSQDIVEGSAIDVQLQKQNVNFRVGDDGEEVSFDYVSDVKIKLIFDIDTKSINVSFKDLENDLELLKQEVKQDKYLSKTNFIN